MAAVKTRNTATLMTEGSIVKSLLLFALPLIFGNLLQQMYNTADSIIVGNFVGSNALAAVGSSGSPIYLLIGFSQGLAVGAGVVVSQYLGAGDHKETREAVQRACGESPGFRALAAGILRRAMRTGFATAPFCGEAEGMRSGMEDDLRIFRRTVCAGLLQPFRNAGQ